MKLNNEFMKLVMQTGDESFLVEAICKTQGEANVFCNLNPNWGVIAESGDGLIFLANIMPCRSVKVHFEDGNTITTRINGTVEAIKKYYVGRFFTFGTCEENEKSVKAIRVEFLDNKVV